MLQEGQLLKTAYEIGGRLVGSEMCIRDRIVVVVVVVVVMVE